MRVTFLLLACIITVATNSQKLKILKGIFVDKSNTPISFCTVSVKGTQRATTTNNCGEFELAIEEEPFTIVFNCGFKPFERSVNPSELLNGETVVFKLKSSGDKIKNTGCKRKIDKRSKRLLIR